jgi:hypothetical protein
MAYGTATYGVGAYGGATFAPLSTPITPGILVDKCLFETPHVAVIPRWLPESTGQQFLLYRHFANEIRGVNAWQRSDGTYCVDYPCNFESAQTHPAGFFSDDPIGPDLTTTGFPALIDTNLNYPWNPFPGSTISTQPGAYSDVYDWTQVRTTFALDPYFTSWFQGGGMIIITQEQALSLTAAGFGDCIS